MGYHRDLHFVTQFEPFLSKYKIIVFRKLTIVPRRNEGLTDCLLYSRDISDLEYGTGRIVIASS